MNKVLLAVFGIALTTQAFAQAASPSAGEVTGVVKVTGSALNAVVSLIGGSEPATFCNGDAVARKISRLAGMTVSAVGVWTSDKISKTRCFEGTSFTVKKNSSGRDAVTGMLAKRDNTYVILSDSGTITQTLQSIPAGLQKLEGKKVILDLKTVDSGAEAKKNPKVVSYSELP